MVVLKHRNKTDFLTFFPIEFKITYLVVAQTNIPFKYYFSPPKNPTDEATQSNFLSSN